MIRFAVVAILLVGCRISLSSEPGDEVVGDGNGGRACTVSTTSQQCLDATTHSDLAWIEANVYVGGCNIAGCHNDSAGNDSRLVLTPGMSAAHLVNVTSSIDPTRKLVVPNNIAASYLMLMLGDVPPAMASPPARGLPSAGRMPQGGAILCCQKLDAVERWITAGAPSN
jgi:hypothetical protein